MSGFFGVVSKTDCMVDLYYGTDYHSHLGQRRAGLVSYGTEGFKRFIHNISNAQFRSKFSENVSQMSGRKGIGIISDYEDQPLIISSHLGTYAICTVGSVTNVHELISKAFRDNNTHFLAMGDGEINPTEVVAMLVSKGGTFAEGIKYAHECIEGSCSILILTANGVIAARDKVGRTPIVLGRKDNAHAVAFESSALPNIGYEVERDLGPGEIVELTEDGVNVLSPALPDMKICSFLWVYYGFPASSYEGVNVEMQRYRSGEFLASRTKIDADMVTGVPDSGNGHGLGYAHKSGLPFMRPFVKYTPTWARSFIPPSQSSRDTVAHMKLIPIPDLIRGRRLLFTDDSIVRGTQLRDTAKMLFGYGAKEVHALSACPPLLFGCKYLNFSRTRSVLELISRRVILEMTGKDDDETAAAFADPDSADYQEMVSIINKKLNLTSLHFQRLDDCVASITLPKEKLCTYCWDGCEGKGKCAGRCCGKK